MKQPQLDSSAAFFEQDLPGFGDPEPELGVPERVDDRVHDGVQHALEIDQLYFQLYQHFRCFRPNSKDRVLMIKLCYRCKNLISLTQTITGSGQDTSAGLCRFLKSPFCDELMMPGANN